MISNLLCHSEIPFARLPHAESLPFDDYLRYCEALIAAKRNDMDLANKKQIIEVNSPFELQPLKPLYARDRIKYGALLIHGLLDCPFSLRDISTHLNPQGILCRSILLPGHGTTPSDLLSISYDDWIKTVRYGVQSLRQEVENIFLIGYSTGAALSIYHAMQDDQIAGIILLAPAIKIKAPVDIAVNFHSLLKTIIRTKKDWLYYQAETDYAKYQSIPFNAVSQVAKLSQVVRDFKRPLNCPMLMLMSHEDETISSHHALKFFSTCANPESELLLYSDSDQSLTDKRILIRHSRFPEDHIKNFSHVALPFAPDNFHYGPTGDYPHASRTNGDTCLFGAYNHLEEQMADFLFSVGLIKQRRRELTYNPDFAFMMQKILSFILR